MFGRCADKVGFNIKFSKKFLGRKSFKLRPDPNDYSMMRSKLCCDIANRLGLPSIQATYARLYMNGEFWGLYVLMDAVKPSWVKETFEPSEKEVTTLYQCKNGGIKLTVDTQNSCKNANDDYPSMDEFAKFINDVENATTTAELEQIVDIKVFIKYLVFEWLIGSFDHFMIYGHNLNWYKREDGKWIVVYYDYDNTYGIGLNKKLWKGKSINQDGTKFVGGTNFVSFCFADWELNTPVLGKLIFQNQEYFKKIVYDVLVQAFNPDLLNSRIDELAAFLTPYIEEDWTEIDGELPGRINKLGGAHSSSVSNFVSNTEDVVRKWINDKFEAALVCYDFDKEQILAESANFTPKPYNYKKYSSSVEEPIVIEETTTIMAEPTQTEIEAAKPTETIGSSHCKFESLGYECCSHCKSIYEDKDGLWGSEHGKWCGISDECLAKIDECWSIKKGYPCCNHCNVYTTDHSGSWGVMNNDWCGIPTSC